jgi:hypothetical protein
MNARPTSKRVQPAGTGRVEVERQRVRNAEQLGELARHGRHWLVGDQRGHDDAIDLLHRHAGLRERMLHRDRREIGGRLVVLGVAPLLDAGELDDLRLGAAGELLQDFPVRHHVFRHCIAQARDARFRFPRPRKP